MPAVITLNWRVLRPLLFILFCVSVPVYYLYISSRPPLALYEDLFTSEAEASKNLIHNERGNKYVKFKQLQGAGFNNQAQEILLYHHLALQTSRIYVYQPLIWRPRGENASVPLSAFLRGPTDGTVSEAVFDEICPPEEVVHVKLGVDHMDQWNYAQEILNGKDRCIVVDDSVFNWNYLASSGIHAVWPSFRKYLSNHFKWSDNVLEITNRTETQLNLKSQSNPLPEGHPYMAIHLRRGDFEDHCKYLAETQQGFTTWATLPILQSSILLPSLDIHNATSVMEHCYPTLHRILDAISHQARERPHLRTLHILHDGAWDHPTVYLQYYKLVAALTNTNWASRERWKGGPMLWVTQSANVPIKNGERDWSVCVDVELGRRAEVFIGNGYSSLSTQVVALRLGDGGKEADITLI
ncbi:hypothetical protein GALMADRAFT_268566 [Galerina marginata CBS 339.88]|uniref:Uncharacterized protein n=1 Tax=Galerina marginata (strain CBS 339.88) TaxID=685588 RepID=A0A067SVS8_GALM3|nr:hypothetical protein GALMADRAFT_268566 [Galerina marginata CBS 339.88]